MHSVNHTQRLRKQRTQPERSTRGKRTYFLLLINSVKYTPQLCKQCAQQEGEMHLLPRSVHARVV